MDFELSDDQKLLLETVQTFVKKESPVERFRKLRESALGWDQAVWKRMGELGWLGVMFPEDAGGAAMSFQEAGLVLEQFGTTLVPEPYIPLVAAGTALVAAGTSAQREQFLAPAVSGDASLALAYAERQGRHDPLEVATTATRRGASYLLRGQKRFVLNGHAANHLVVSARTAGGERERPGISLFVVDPSTRGVRVRKVEHMDGHKGALIDFEDAELPAERLLGEEGDGAAALERAVDFGAAAACAEGSGCMQSVLAMTRDYLTSRKQFGVAIGTFQALQHRCVDMFVETELSKGTALMSMIKADAPNDEERKRAISAAKLQLWTGGAFVTRQGIQLHGGIGVTDEADVGLFFKRVHVLSTIFGDEHFHTRRFASLPSFTHRLG